MAKTVIWLASNLAATKDLMDNTFTDLWGIGVESLVALTEGKDSEENIKRLNNTVKDSMVMSLSRKFPLEAVSQLMNEKNFNISIVADASPIFSKYRNNKINFNPALITELQDAFKLPESKFEDLYIALDICTFPVNEAAQIYYSLKQAIGDRAILYVSSANSSVLADKWIKQYYSIYEKQTKRESIVIYNRYGVAVTATNDYTSCLLLSVISSQ